MIDYRENAKWTVYVHISPSGKYYVGVTSQPPKQRWHNGRGYAGNPHFTRAIEKHGWENFQHEIICSGITEDEAYAMEITLIKKLKSSDYHYGYNISEGGKGSSMPGEKNPCYGKRLSEEHKQILSKTHKGKKLSEEHIKIISESSKKMWNNEEHRKRMSGENHPCYGRTGELHPMYGKHGSEVANSKKVICLNTLEIFDSAVDAAKIKKVNHSKLCMCCRGERKCCGKNDNGEYYAWMFYDDYLLIDEDEVRLRIIKANDNKYKHQNSYKKIVDVESKQLYSSIITATRVNNLKSNARIGQACKNPNETAYKHHWRYYGDYLKEYNLTDEEARLSLFFVA